MTDKAISPLRQRLIDDMTIRRFGRKTQHDYIRHVKNFADFVGRSPDKATVEDVHRYQLWLASIGTTVATVNVSATALRFFFRVTLKRHDLAEEVVSAREPRRLPVVLSPEEVGRLLAATRNIKHKALLSLAYATGLRASEVISLKLTDIDSGRMVVRVEQGKGKKDRYVMLSPNLLRVLREWWSAARKKGWMPRGQPWLFPGYRGQHMSARQLHRIVRLAAGRASITKRVGVHTLRHSFATHLLEQKTDIRVIQVLLGHRKLDTTALYTRVAIKAIGEVTSPLDLLLSEVKPPPDARPLSRPTVEVADIFRHRGPAWRASHAGHLSLGQLKVMSAIERCRTAALGGHVERCEACAHLRVSYNSCRNRHCPKCQAAAAKGWLADRRAELLPVPYFHIVFTLPRPIADIAYQNKAVVYDLLLKTAAETLITIAADPKHLGARIGLTAVLHTWGSTLVHHPHAHIIVPGGGLSPDRQRWIACRPRFFLSVRVLSRLFRRLFLEALADAYQAGRLHFFAGQAALAEPAAFKTRLAALRKREWVVYAKRPFAGPEAVLAYLSRYTHRIAIANSRLVAFDGERVTFKWKDYRAKADARYKLMTLDADEFIRRFLIHILPSGFHRIRHYGLFANANRADSIALARQLLGVPEPAPSSGESDGAENAPEDEARNACCPSCGGRMIIVEIFEPGCQPRFWPVPAIGLDSS